MTYVESEKLRAAPSLRSASDRLAHPTIADDVAMVGVEPHGASNALFCIAAQERASRQPSAD
jgi:hypothetical protein